MASLIITASTTGPTLALNPLLTSPIQTEVAQVETYSVEMPTSSTAQAIYNKIVKASDKYGIDTDTRIAKCESDFRQYTSDGEVMRGEKNPDDVGIFQINEKYHLEGSQALGFDIHKTNDNIDYAMWLMKKEGNRHWNWSKPCWGTNKQLKNA